MDIIALFQKWFLFLDRGQFHVNRSSTGNYSLTSCNFFSALAHRLIKKKLTYAVAFSEQACSIVVLIFLSKKMLT